VERRQQQIGQGGPQGLCPCVLSAAPRTSR
jgi:hypothetical protein